MTALHELTAIEQCSALVARTIGAVELAEHYLDRIDRLAGPLGAFVVTTSELALREAAAADRLLSDGSRPDRTLLGLPIAFKDLQPIAGVPVTNGSTAIPRHTAEIDAAAVGAIRVAGAVTLGTTHAPEFGIPCYTDTAVVGRAAVTPYDVERSASGSSGGTAGAVAAGLVPVGHGSDGAGSIRTPAAVCGLVGIKPGRGVVSAAPVHSFFAFTTDGPIARTVADAALLLDVMAVEHATGLHEVPQHAGRSFLAATRQAPHRRLRVAVWSDSGFGDPHSETVLAVGRAAALIEELGHEIVEVTNPAPWDAAGADALFDYIAGVVASMLAELPPAAAAALQEDTRWMRERGDRLTATDFVRSTATLAAISSRLIAGLAPFDLALTPVSSGPAVPLGHFHGSNSEPAALRMLQWSAYTPLQNTTGLPAVALPSHVTPDGLPIGVQLTGARLGDEPLLLGLAARLEEAIGWPQRHPPQWWM